MDQQTISFIISILAFIVAAFSIYLVNDYRKRSLQEAARADNHSTRPLQLQAYERLVVLAERISMPNLISRVNTAGLTSREMQSLLNESIKQEYEYNTSQQIYVSPVAWEAVTNLKEQNMLIINQVAGILQAESTGTDLNRALLEFVMTQKKGTLHSIVLEALNYEARKIMK
ncbi:MAG: hypothetical protein EOO09_10640 [Chitinophagaceae bacterium]|nr:MAG: hypothetical protein EOO09_10640 [Chitinophagaceae bacterium]